MNCIYLKCTFWKFWPMHAPIRNITLKIMSIHITPKSVPTPTPCHSATQANNDLLFVIMDYTQSLWIVCSAPLIYVLTLTPLLHSLNSNNLRVSLEIRSISPTTLFFFQSCFGYSRSFPLLCEIWNQFFNLYKNSSWNLDWDFTNQFAKNWHLGQYWVSNHEHGISGYLFNYLSLFTFSQKYFVVFSEYRC